MNWQPIVDEFKQCVPALDFWSLRLVDDETETLSVRENVAQPPASAQSRGAYITLVHRGGMAYGATSDLNAQGFKRAIESAMNWLAVTRRHALLDVDKLPRPSTSGRYRSGVAQPWHGMTLNDKVALLQQVNSALKIDPAIVYWEAHLKHRRTSMVLCTSDGVNIEQTFHYIVPGCAAVANRGAETQMRTGGGWGGVRQGGLEQLAAFGFPDSARQVAEEALVLVDAPQCPSGTMSVLLTPSQMMLQIHESIGHPLELDRILGDERNYAGRSFVTMDMFGHYQYGSELLNVTYDPSHPEEVASYGFDDDGSPAQRVFLIRNGVLERPLGGAISQFRAGIDGVANARACDWNRPPIDRMANLNLELGNRSMQELIASIENGVLMDTNRSWSIDDSRNKFQFGCEWGRLIQDGELKDVVKNPSYRGVSAEFWRNLVQVGDRGTFEIWGTPYCGKGEPNQVIQVGHASPACMFSNVEVFGGA